MREISVQMIDHHVSSFWWKELVKYFVRVGDKLEIRCWKEELSEIQQAAAYGDPTEDNYEVSVKGTVSESLLSELLSENPADKTLYNKMTKYFTVNVECGQRKFCSAHYGTEMYLLGVSEDDVAFFKDVMKDFTEEDFSVHTDCCKDDDMNNINLRAVSDTDAEFLCSVMNADTILKALNELPTPLCDWVDAIKEWCSDEDEEDYIISSNETPIGWIGINGLSSTDKTAYLKLIAILPDHHNKGIGHHAINQVIEMLRQKGYLKIALYTDQDNRKAQACYSKCGFEITETLTERMSNGKLVARCKMELTI